jgi:hypothetical protein
MAPGSLRSCGIALCWVHAERLIHPLIPLNAPQRQNQERVRDALWSLDTDLKAYPRDPDPAAIPGLRARVEALITQKTSFATLNQTLKRLKTHPGEWRPDIPLHTNGSENDIRGDVKWRKIRGGTRSDLGRRCRETCASLKKTCRKLGAPSGKTSMIASGRSASFRLCRRLCANGSWPLRRCRDLLRSYHYAMYDFLT